MRLARLLTGKRPHRRPPRHFKIRPPRAPRHKVLFEPLEPRLLLSADGLVPGLTVALETGLLTSGNTLFSPVVSDMAFNTPVPGVLQSTHDVNGANHDDGPNGKVDDKDLQVPDVRDVLSLNVNRDGSADSNGFETIAPITLVTVDKSDLKDVFRYVDGQKTFIFPVIPSTEQALNAMDLNSGSPPADNIVDFREIYNVLVVGAISDFLADYTPVPMDPDPIATLQSSFLSFLSGLSAPSSVGSLIDLDLTGVSNNSDATHFSFSFTVNLKVKDQFLIDLGLNADKNEIIFPETTYTAGTPDDPNTAANELVAPGLADAPDGTRTVELDGSISVPFSFKLDIPVANFRFAVPNPIGVAVDDMVSGSGGETLNGLIMNVGFLGTEVPGPNSASKFNLHMDWSIVVTDPSSPINLGFTQALPTSSSTGGLTAATALPNDPGTQFVFPLDVFFDLTIGSQMASSTTTVTVTAASTTDNSTAINLKDDVQTALNAAGLGAIVTAGLDGSDKLTLSLPSTDITPLGFDGQEHFDEASPFELIAANAPAILGTGSTTPISFLLSVGGAPPELVTVTPTPADDDNDGNATLGDLSLPGLLADINAALSGVGLGAVTASNSGTGKVKLSHASSSLEVTRTLKLDAKFEITSTERNDPSFPEFLKASQDTSDDTLNIVMPLNIRQGLDFSPTGSPGIKVDVEPFNPANTGLTPDAALVPRLTLPLKDSGGILAIDAIGSNFLQYLDFNAVGPGEAIGMIQQLETWLAKLRDTDMLGKFSIPFAQAVLGKLLAFDDMLHDTLLTDDKDSDKIADEGKLLAKITAIDPDAFVTSFGTAQELGARLDKLFLPSILIHPTVNTDGDTAGADFAAYDKTTRQLTYQLSLSHVLEADNVAADYTANVDLEPDVIGDISTQSKVHLQATGHFDAILGMQLGPAQITTSTLLADLNGGLGAGIATGTAFTGAGDVNVIRGRLSADAHFSISINSGAPVDVSVAKSATDTNVTTQHLLDDINSALLTAGLNTQLQAVEILGRIVLKAINPSVAHFSVNTSPTDTAYSELGLASTVATTVLLQVEPASVKVSSDVTLNFEANNDGNIIPITLHDESTGAAATGGNNTLTDLANDINEALAATSLNGKVVATRSGAELLLVGIDSAIKSFRVSSGGGPASEIGFGSPQVAGVFMVALNDLGTPLTLPNNPINLFGQLSADAHFNVVLNTDLPVAVTVAKTATDGNTSLDDTPDVVKADELIDDINAALATAGLGSKVKAERVGNFRIAFRAIDASVLSFQVTAAGADPAVTELGLATSQTADAALRIMAIKDAPFFFGPASDATFDITITGGSSAGTKTVMVKTNETLTDRTIQDLAGDVRRALDAAFGSVAANPLLVSNDGNRLLLTPKSTGAGVGVTGFTITAALANPAIADLKLYQAGTSLAGPNVTSSADTVDLLIYTRDNAVRRITLDSDTTIGDVLADIDPDGLGVGVDATINDNAAGLKLIDNTAGTALFRIDSVNGSHAAQALGIFGADTDANNPDPDGKIDGTRIATLQLADRFFLRQVSPTTNILSADIVIGAATFNAEGTGVVDLVANTIKVTENKFTTGDPVVYKKGGGINIGGLTDGTTYYIIVVNPDDPNTIKLATSKANATANTAVDLTGAGTGIQRLESFLALEANFGFVGVTLAGSGTLSGKFGMGLQDTSGTATVQLSHLLEALSKDQDPKDGDVDVFDLATLVAYPTVSPASGTDFGTLTFVTALQDGLPAGTIDINTGAVIKLTLDAFGNPFAGATDVTFASAGVDTNTDAITKTAHGLTNGMEVVYRHGIGGTDIGGLTDGGHYFVIVVDANNFQLTATAGGTAINLTSQGGGTGHRLQGFVPVPAHATVDYTDPNLADLVNFTEIHFDDVIGALQGLSSFLSQFSAFSFLNQEIPLLGVSFNDLVDIAKRFETAVTEIVKNPAGTVQAVEQKIKETFGLPPSSTVFSLSLTDNGDMDANSTDMLKVKLNLSKEFSKALNADLDLSDQLPGVSLMGSAGLNAAGNLTALLTFGVDLDDPTQLYLFTNENDTKIGASLTAKADNLTFNAALGPLGIFITGGDVSFELGADFKSTSAAPGSKESLSEVLLNLTSFFTFTPTSLTGNLGSLKATLPVFFPTESTFKGDIEFEATLTLGPAPDYDFDFDTDLEVPPDILNVDFSKFSLFDSVILAVDTFDAFLGGVQDLLDGEIFGVKLPLIGDKLSAGAEFISDVRKGVIQPFRELVQTAKDKGAELIQGFIFDLLGPGNGPGDPGPDVPGLHLLLDPTELDPAGNPTPATASDRSHINDIVQIKKNLTGPISTNFAQWNFTIGQVYTPPLDFDFDLGFPGLSLDLDGNLIFSLGWKLNLGLGISIKDGPYIEVTSTNSTDDPLSHVFPNTPDVGAAANAFDNISPHTSDLDTSGTPNGAAGGRINGLATDPTSNMIFYAASEYGGIYKTEDGGDTWKPLENHLPQVTWDVEVDPSDHNRVYATSFYDGRVPGHSIAGINVSTNGGTDWTHPASAVPNNSGGVSDNTPQEGFSFDPLRAEQPSAYGISINRNTPANVAIGTNTGVAISHNSGVNWQFFNPYTASVFFDTNLFNIDLTDDTTTLNAFIPIIQKYLTDYPTANVEVAGYTDTQGTTASNQTLSDNRADAVRDYLVAHGVATGRINIIGFGEQTAHLAVDTGDGENDGVAGTAEQANRRTEIHLQAVDIYDVVYQAGGIIDIVGALGHARSTDNGAHWLLPHQPVAGIGAISIAASPDENNVLFAVGTDNTLYESDNAGVTWTSLGQDTSPQGRIPFVTVNNRPGTQFDVWFGDTNLFRIPANTANAPGLRAATAASTLWVPSNNGAHADVADVVFDSTGVPKLHSNDGGVYRNIGGDPDPQVPTWEQPTVTPHGLFIMGFQGVDQPGNDEEDLYFTLQDDGVWALTKAGAAHPEDLSVANGGWHNAASADAFDIAADNDRVLFNNGVFAAPPAPSNPSGRREHAVLGPQGLPAFDTTPELGIYPSGAVIDFKHSEAFDTWGDDKFAMLTADNNVFNDNTFGPGGLFITTNIKDLNAAPWTRVMVGTLVGGPPPNTAQFADLQVALDGAGVPTFYVTVGSGTSVTADQLWKVTGVAADGSGTATATWERIDSHIDNGNAMGVSIFAAARTHPELLYAAALMNTGQPKIWRSNNGGTTWTADTTLDSFMTNPDQAGGDDFLYINQLGPADFPFNQNPPTPQQGLTGYPQPTLLAFDQEDPTPMDLTDNLIVAGGADSGVFLSKNSGATWELLSDPLGTNLNLPHIPRPRFAYFDHEGGATTLFIASQGGGIWRIKLAVPADTTITSLPDPTGNTTGTAENLTGAEPSLNDFTINSNTDLDFFKYTPGFTGNAIVNLYFDNLFGDLNVEVQDSGGTTIATGEQSNLKDHLDLERIIFPVVDGNHYFIKVSGASGATGYYDLVLQKSRPELDLFIVAGIGTGSTLTGKLAFLQLDVTAVDTNFIGSPDADPTGIRADFTVDIFNGDNPADNRLSLFELGSIDAAIGLTAEAKVNFELQLGLNEDLLPDTIAAAIPKVKAEFHLDWSVGGPIGSLGLDNLANGLKLIEFTNVGIDLGSFLSDTVGPIIAKIQEITEPLQPIIDIVTARIPVLSDLAGRTITLVDIAAAFGEFDPSLIYAVADIISLVNTIDTGGGQSLFLKLGDFKLVDVEHPDQALFGGDGSTLTNPNSNFNGMSDSDFANKLNDLRTAAGQVALSDLTNSSTLDSFLGGDSGAPAATTTKSLFSGGFSSTPDDSGFAFPIFKNPSQIFGLLLGRNATIITYDLPPFLLDFKWEVSFPIYPPLYGVVTAGIGLKIDLAFGYDTQGIKDFAEGGFENPLDLLSGFFVSDTNMPDGSFGVDVPELVFTGTIGVGAELNAGIASAGVTANIILTVNFDLFDPNHDGKVRIDELVSTFLFEARNGNPALAPIAIFDVFGNVAFQLSAFIKFLFAKFEFDITPPIVLFEFSIPFEREPILATERGDGSVLLNIGPNAEARQNGDTRDIAETIHVKDAGSGKVAVWSDQFGVPESAAQLYSIGDGKPVVGFGGDGDDTIDASALTSNPVMFEGGSGNDTLKGGSGKDVLKGDIGDDHLFGNGGNDVIYGGEGNDEIDGGADDDIIFGDTGKISTDAMNGSVRSSIGPKDGDDNITGGAGKDIIFGDGGDDAIGGDKAVDPLNPLDPATLDAGGQTDEDFIFGDGGSISAPGGIPIFVKMTNPDGTVTFGTNVPQPDLSVKFVPISLTDHGGGGKDIIRGQGGKDVIYGGSGDDDLDGGAQDDTIFGESGLDLISGGADADFIMGGSEDDRIFGFRDENYPGDLSDGGDTIFGQTGNDFIRGNRGDDILHGNAGADIIFGDFGNDTITGDTEPDLIFGGPDRDTIDAGTGNDIVFGDDGFVVWVNFFDLDLEDMIDTPNDHKAIGLIGGDADVFDNVFNPAIMDAQLDALDANIRMHADDKVKTLDLIKTLINPTDGNDTITGGEGDDIVLGGADALFSGVKGDTIYGDFNPGTAPGTPPAGPIPAGADILIGDGGRIQFDDRRRDNVRTIPGLNAAQVGNDTISGNGGDDLIFGGGAADTLYGRMNAAFTNPDLNEASSVPDNDIILGDDGEIQYQTLGLIEAEPGPFIPGEEAELGVAKQTLAGARAVFVFIRTEQLDANALATGGIDHAFGNKGDDIIFGGVAGDVLKGDDGADGDDIIFGDNGKIEYGLDNDGITTKITQLYTTDTLETTGGPDTIEGQDGNDIILGGVNNGGTDIIYGDRATPIDASDGQDIILGDNGKIRFNVDADLDTLDSIESFLDGRGGSDTISGNRGDDVLIGSTGGDTMYGDDATASAAANDGEDIMLGDNGNIVLIGTVGRLIVHGTAVDLITTTDTLETTGGADTMSGNAKADIMLGGVNNGGTDTMYGDRAAPNATTIANDGDDVLLGDNGLLDFTFLADTDRNTLDLISSFEDGHGGADVISGNKGLDVAIGGTNGDTIYGDDAGATAAANDLADILLGDNADIFLVAKGGAVGGDLKLVLGSAVKTIKTTDEENPGFGGSDTISGNAKGDIIAGGVKGDTLYGDRAVPNATTIGNEGNDTILGDNGTFEWLSTGRLGEITGIDIAMTNPALFAKYNAAVADSDLTTLDLITTEQPTSGGRDLLYGDHGKDVVFGGTDADTIYGDDGNETGDAANNDVLFGDHGRIYPQFSTLAGFNSRNFFAIDIGNLAGGEGDRMFGEEGADTMLGQQGDDRMFGGSGDDDMVGGHNVSGGYDELTAPAIVATLNPPVNDVMDGGTGNDAMAGDNTTIWRRGDDVSPRFRLLTAAALYTTTNATITANVGSVAQSDPDDVVGRDITLLDHSDAVQANPLGRFGNDVMAGNADRDTMFGQLGDDLMQGDGYIGTNDNNPLTVTRAIVFADSGSNPDTDETLYFNIPEAVSDADDYMEGNGGNDLMYGNLGQDDMIGGSSALYGLSTEAMRPDGSDTIFGGAGIDTSRNNIGDATEDGTTHVITTVATGHSRDADYIMGDNANVFRPVKSPDDFLTFAYDNYTNALPLVQQLKIIPRAMQQLDYTLGGADYRGGTYVNGAAQLVGQPADNGAADLIHGESGDDIIFGMTGSDVLFGEGQDDDIVGGYGNDWISGGTGQDGVLGDDGLIYTSRNSTTGEALYNIAGLLANDPSTKDANGNVLNETISTPGQIQSAVIHVAGELKKTLDLVPFSYDPNWIATDDEFPDNATNTPFADDIIFGGLGSDFLHGASGDDAVSGAEALEHAYVPTYDANGNPAGGVLDLGYNAFVLPNPINPGDLLALNPNPGDVLAFSPEDADGQHLNNRFRAGEFDLYDEYNALRKILLTDIGDLSDTGAGKEFLLNFNKDEGVLRPGGTTSGNQNQSVTYGPVRDDGNDAIFGDLGNDWLVGGTGRDDMYGGWGNDLINADDNQDTNGKLNDQPDTHPTYEDRAYGGAGRDVLIANTGGDRLIDWVGEYNTYLVPFAPFGEATVSRTLQPFLPEYLYALSKADGADPTRPADTGADPLRNGEPNGELGLVLQKDFAWQAQTGAPADPQAGNIPGGKRDVLRSADFNDGQSQAFFVDSGTWTVTNARYQVAPTTAGGDAVSVFFVNAFLPNYFEMLATINAVKPTGGTDANAYVIFDYQDKTNFKFAGINVSTNKLEIGHRTAQGWIVDKQGAFPGTIKSGTDYNVFLALNGSSVTLTVNNQVTMTYTFAPRVDVYGISHGLSEGMVGLGAKNAKAQIDNVVVQRVPPAVTLNQTVDFSSGTTSLFQAPLSGSWNLVSGRYEGTASGSTPAIDLTALKVSSSSLIDLLATFKTTGEGGFLYDEYSATDFKFVTLSVTTRQILMGHRTAKGWFTDAVYNNTSLTPGVDYTLGVTLKGSTVSVTLNGATVLSRAYNALVTDGNFGLLSRTGTTSFDTVTVRTDDPAFAVSGGTPLLAVAVPSSPASDASTLTAAMLAPIVDEAMADWSTSALVDAAAIARLAEVNFQIVDLQGLALGETMGTTVFLDATGADWGWFVDDTPTDNAEFRPSHDEHELLATPASPASGHMDLLTVVRHELGHVLGFDDLDPALESHDLMSATLAPGVRHPVAVAAALTAAHASQPAAAVVDIHESPPVLVFNAASGTFQPQLNAPASEATNGALLDVEAFNTSSTRRKPARKSLTPDNTDLINWSNALGAQAVSSGVFHNSAVDWWDMPLASHGQGTGLLQQARKKRGVGRLSSFVQSVLSWAQNK